MAKLTDQNGEMFSIWALVNDSFSVFTISHMVENSVRQPCLPVSSTVNHAVMIPKLSDLRQDAARKHIVTFFCRGGSTAQTNHVSCSQDFVVGIGLLLKLFYNDLTINENKCNYEQ
jgi:hypothetical protein